MLNEHKVKFKKALAKVLADVHADVQAKLPETGPADNALNFNLPIIGSDNFVAFLIDNSKEPHVGKYNVVIGVTGKGTNQLEAVHAVVGQTKAQIIAFFANENLPNRLCDRLEMASDTLDANK